MIDPSGRCKASSLGDGIRNNRFAPTDLSLQRTDHHLSLVSSYFHCVIPLALVSTTQLRSPYSRSLPISSHSGTSTPLPKAFVVPPLDSPTLSITLIKQDSSVYSYGIDSAKRVSAKTNSGHDRKRDESLPQQPSAHCDLRVQFCQSKIEKEKQGNGIHSRAESNKLLSLSIADMWRANGLALLLASHT